MCLIMKNTTLAFTEMGKCKHMLLIQTHEKVSNSREAKKEIQEYKEI